MNLLRHTTFWTPQVTTCSALENKNIDAVWGMIVDYHLQARENGWFAEKRSGQNRDWMHQLIGEMLQLKLSANPKARELLPRLEKDVAAQRMTAYAAAHLVIDCL